MINKIDENNMKALSVTKVLLNAIECGNDDIDYISLVGVIHDYLQMNDKIFDENKQFQDTCEKVSFLLGGDGNVRKKNCCILEKEI